MEMHMRWKVLGLAAVLLAGLSIPDWEVEEYEVDDAVKRCNICD